MLESKLQKVLKPRHLWALAVGAVCSGNYYGFSYGFETGGPGSFLLAFLPVTAMYVCFMACYMELAVSSPSAGGASEYARRSMGGFAGFIAGFSVLVAYIVAPCAVAITTGQLLHYLVPAIPAMTATVVFFCLFVALNLLGAKSSSRFELIATIAALAGLVLFAVVALPHFQPERLMLDEVPAAGLSGVAAAVPFAMWFYFAVDGPIMQSEEMEDPKTGILRGYVPALVTLFITALIMYALVILSNIRLYWQEPTLERPFEIPHPVVPGIAMVLVVLLFICVLVTNLSALKWVVVVYANGVSLKEIQEWLGHSDIATTSNIYTHLNFTSKVASANAILGVYPSA